MRINNTQQPTFGYTISLDVGASNKKGTLKCSVKHDDGTDIFETSGFVNNTVNGFRSPNQFVTKLARIVSSASNTLAEKVEAGEVTLVGDDKKLSGVSIFVPGTTVTKGQHDEIAFIPNLRDRHGNSLTDINFSAYENALKNEKNMWNIPVNTEKFKLVATKDLAGCGLAISRKMLQKGLLKEGDYVMAVMTGGGFGSVDIKRKHNCVEVEASESSSYLTGNHLAYNDIEDIISEVANSDNPQEVAQKYLANDAKALKEQVNVAGKLGRQGVSVRNHISCFLDTLGRKDLEELLIAVGDARIVEDNIMFLKKDEDAKLIEQIRDHKEFIEIESGSASKVAFKFDEDLMGKEALHKARTAVVNDYANSISLIGVNKINDFVNKIVLVGPFAHGVNRYVKEHKEDFKLPQEKIDMLEKEFKDYGFELEDFGMKDWEVNDLADLIKQKVLLNTSKTKADLTTTRRLMKLNNFEIICDSDINIANNTEAGDILLNKNLSFVRNRGNWIDIPVKSLLYP